MADNKPIEYFTNNKDYAYIELHDGDDWHSVFVEDENGVISVSVCTSGDRERMALSDEQVDALIKWLSDHRRK